MPACTMKRGTLRWRGSVLVQGIQRQKLFPDDSKNSERAAIIWEAETKKALEKELTRTPSVCLKVLDWANAYLREAKTRYVKKTFQEKRQAFSFFLNSIGPDLEIADLDVEIASKYLSSQTDKRSGYASNKDRKNLSAGWSWAKDKMPGFPKGQNPFSAVSKHSEDRQDRYVPPEEDFWKVFELTEGQDRVMLTAFLNLAARRNEVLGLKWKDVDFSRSQVRLWCQKRRGGNKEFDWLPMTTELKSALLWWRDQRLAMDIEDKEHIFICLDRTPFCEQYYGKPFTVRQQFMKRLCEKAGVKPFGFHAIRHLAASIVYGKGGSVADIQAILRHKNSNTTSRYTRSLGLEQVRGVLEVGLARPGAFIAFPNKKASGE